MTILLFPGRHLLHTEFQRSYLLQILQVPLAQLAWHNDNVPDLPPIDDVVFAITSCNQQNSRYNAIPFHVRAIGVDRFARTLQQSLDFDYRILGIPHYQPTPRFSKNVIKEVEAQTEGSIALTPKNCVVVCSTPAVIAQYEAMGFSVLTAELGRDDVQTPVDVLRHFVSVGERWQTDLVLRQHLSSTTNDLWRDFPDVPTRALRLWREPLLNDSGSLTETRDYATYAYEMAKPGAMQLKYDDIRSAIRPGKIVDEGCADAALLSLMAKDFPDSDLIGIELTGEFLARCHERQRAGDFGGTFVHFHQRNIMEPVFAPNSIDTTICNSTIHELWSYGQQQANVDSYLRIKFEQTCPGGHLIARDVVGPDDKDREVYLWLNHTNGKEATEETDVLQSVSNAKQLANHLDGLSTYGRFQRFAHDYLRESRESGDRSATTQVTYRKHNEGQRRFVVLPLRHAAEFITKMTYTHNWASEMLEEFTFWDFEQWCAAFRRAGFRVLRSNENTNDEPASRAYCNPWLVENRFQGKAEIYTMQDGKLIPLPYPATNIVMVGEKPSSHPE